MAPTTTFFRPLLPSNSYKARDVAYSFVSAPRSSIASSPSSLQFRSLVSDDPRKLTGKLRRVSFIVSAAPTTDPLTVLVTGAGGRTGQICVQEVEREVGSVCGERFSEDEREQG